MGPVGCLPACREVLPSSRAWDSDHVLVQSAAPDAESASAFHEAALAHAWKRIPPEQPEGPGQREVFIRFLLDRRLWTRGLGRSRDAAVRGFCGPHHDETRCLHIRRPGEAAVADPCAAAGAWDGPLCLG